MHIVFGHTHTHTPVRESGVQILHCLTIRLQCIGAPILLKTEFCTLPHKAFRSYSMQLLPQGIRKRLGAHADC